MDTETNPYFRDTGRVLEVVVGLIVLAVALPLGYFGARGAVMFLRGSRAAPADPLAAAVGIVAGLGGGFVGLRLLLGWHDEQALLPNALLFLAGIGAIGGAIWIAIIDRELHGSSTELRYSLLFAVVGIIAVVLAWRRWRGARRQS